MIDASDITDDVCLAALRGWAGYPKDHDLSPYQQSPETKSAWRRAIMAALTHLAEKEGIVIMRAADYQAEIGGYWDFND